MAEISNRFKLAAIDLDGTLLGPDHAISDANAEAVRRLQAIGAQVVLASGRHFNSMRRYVEALPGVQWVVSCQGGEVSDASRTTVLSRQFLPAAAVEKTLEAGHALGFSTVAYTAEGVFTDSASDFEMDFYTDLAGHRPEVLNRGELLAQDIFKVIWMGEPADFSRVVLSDVVSPPIQAVRTNTRFLEFMPTDVSKGSALAILASHLGIYANWKSGLGEAVLGHSSDRSPEANASCRRVWKHDAVANFQKLIHGHEKAKTIFDRSASGKASTSLAPVLC